MKMLLSVLLLPITGCATQVSHEALIGLSRQQLLGCIEQAESGEVSDNWELLRFTGSTSETICPLKRLAGMEPSMRSCTVEFSLKEDQVESVRYFEPDGDEIGDTSRCAFLVEKCIK